MLLGLVEHTVCKKTNTAYLSVGSFITKNGNTVMYKLVFTTYNKSIIAV